ncbi:MAG: hypothetical protein FD168_7 [Desulfobulbaceae bacterium]|nr:MAG: hypothetical protein FD168_7 [Desulfobulbaceae bacterium]
MLILLVKKHSNETSNEIQGNGGKQLWEMKGDTAAEQRKACPAKGKNDCRKKTAKGGMKGLGRNAGHVSQTPFFGKSEVQHHRLTGALGIFGSNGSEDG